MDTLRIFNIPLHSISDADELLSVLEGLAVSDGSKVIFTPNPEILLHGRTYPPYAKVLTSADLLIPDGFGIQLVGFLRHRKVIHRYPGIDLGQLLLNVAYEKRMRVLFLGGRNGSAISAAERLTKKHSDLQIYAAGDNVEIAESGEVPDPKEERRIADAILQTKPAIVLVGLGSPKQEEWVARHRDDFPSVRLFVGVGGAFDVWANRLKRAPVWMRSMGLEWLWRLLLEPTRLPRIIKAVIVFPFYALFR